MQVLHTPTSVPWFEAALDAARRAGDGRVAFFGAGGHFGDPRRIAQWAGHAFDDPIFQLPPIRDGRPGLEPPFDGGLPVHCTVINPPPLTSVVTPPPFWDCEAGWLWHRNGPAECLDADVYPRQIQRCMADQYRTTTWPETDCVRPCVDSSAAYVPSSTARGQIAHLFTVRQLTRMEAQNDVVWYHITGEDRTDEIDYIRAAIALLRDQFDLV
ncbi:MAG: hypothetical protein KC621_26185 [Myxococcales bacterium]|nr:hypothetical protein [Myxococcales bacterium]